MGGNACGAHHDQRVPCLHKCICLRVDQASVALRVYLRRQIHVIACDATRANCLQLESHSVWEVGRTQLRHLRGMQAEHTHIKHYATSQQERVQE